MTVDGPDEVTGPWWDATRRREFVLQCCLACGHRQHYPRALCTACGGAELEFQRASGRGTVDTWTEVMRSPDPQREAPYVLARVRLAEGPILLTNLVSLTARDDLIDSPVELDWAPLSDGRHLPVFKPSVR